MAPIPQIIYGTAWKEKATTLLVETAVNAGFTGIDTANQKKHYREDFVGESLLLLAKLGIKRESLFLQSKYTYINGQDHRLPYDPKDSFSTQVKASFASTLKNLHTDYLDSYLLHGPSSGAQLQDADWEVWETMQDPQVSGLTKYIGVSNVGIHHLRDLVDHAKFKPKFVQNRCYAERGWDRDVREYCKTQNIIYQGFSLLTANQQAVQSQQVEMIAKKYCRTPEQVIFRFSQQIGMLPLTGTSSEQHMKEDLQAHTFELTLDEVSFLDTLYGV